MQESLVNSLCAQRTGIHARWDALLRTERVTSPLAYPDSMVHLIDWALNELFASLREPAGHRRPEHSGGRAVIRAHCPCGKNPLLAFFRAGEQAMLEALVLEQAAHRPIDPRSRDSALNELCYAIRTMERREVEAFCSVCQRREQPHVATSRGAHGHGHGHAHASTPHHGTSHSGAPAPTAHEPKAHPHPHGHGGA